ncbi:MAG: hypothetical protein K6B65_03380 [Bacilli bacterium]|nr:hypothetical protein [Bacilli bacterium]
MRLIGRILLLVAVALLLYSGISGIFANIALWKTLGEFSFEAIGKFFSCIGGFLVSGIYIILALPALIGVIRCKCGMWMLIFALILGIGAAFVIYQKVSAKELNDINAVMALAGSVAGSVCYTLGTLFILFRLKR